jgi:hypothetical protein
VITQFHEFLNLIFGRFLQIETTVQRRRLPRRVATARRAAQPPPA